SSALVRATTPPADPARDLAARARRGRRPEHADLGEPPRARTLRARKPGGAGTAARPLLVGRSRPDRGPGPHARSRAPCVPVASDRTPADLRRRREHGRPGDPPPAGPPPAPARRCRGVRRAVCHGPPLPRLPPAQARAPAPAARALRDRRPAVALAEAVRGAQPARARAPDRVLRRPARALVEPSRPRGRRPGGA